MVAPPRPRLVQVAAAAGVSVSSASRALSGISASPEMVARVQEAARTLGYVADVTARSLKVGRTEQLALAVADLGNPVYVSITRAVESVVRSAGFRLVVSATGGAPDDELAVVREANRGYADGLILIPLHVTDELVAELRACRVPLAVIGTLPRGAAIDNVRANSTRGVELAVEHLISQGCRRIGFVNGPADTVPGRARRDGFTRALAAAGLDAALELQAADFTHAAGVAVAARVDPRRIDAVICANDLLAIGVMRVLRASGVHVPGQVAVVGMDDTDLVDICVPALTSVSLGSEQRGKAAARMLLDRIAEPDRRPRRVTVQPDLVVRASSAVRSGA